MSPRAACIVGVLVAVVLVVNLSPAFAQTCPSTSCTLVPRSFAGTAQNIGLPGRGQISAHAKCEAPAVDLGPRRGDATGYATYVKLISVLRNSTGEWVEIPDTSVCLAMKRGSDDDSAVWEAVTTSSGPTFKVQISRPSAEKCGDILKDPYRIDNIRLDRATITKKPDSCFFTTALRVFECVAPGPGRIGTCPKVNARTGVGVGTCPDASAPPLLTFSANVQWENPDDPLNGCDPDKPPTHKLRAPVQAQSCAVNSDCASGTYCAKPTGSCNVAGVCTRRPERCLIGFYDPVCGCDGQTYTNAGCAALAGVNVSQAGVCRP
jgi:hypothetical protein